MKRKAIVNRLSVIKTEATAIIDSADKDGAGKLSAEQKAKFDGLMAEKVELEETLKRVEQIEAMSESTGRIADASVPAMAEVAETRIELGEERSRLDPMRGFKSTAEFARSVQAAGKHGSRVDKRLIALNRDESGISATPSSFMFESGSSDGYQVPPQISADVTKMVLGDEGLISRFAPEPTLSNSVEDNIDESTPWGSTGVLAYWVAEAGQMSVSKLATKHLRTELHKLYAFVLASDELLEDAPRLQNRLTVASADAIKWKAEEALINGSGAGQPMGVMTAASLVSVTKETNQTAATIVAANALKMRSRLLGDGSGAFWLAHSSAIPQLGQMTVGYQPVWGDSNKEIKSALGAVLLGLPIVISEHCQTVGTAGDIQLIQPKGYASYVKSSGVQFAMSMHLYFDYGLNAFRWTFRLGGNPKLSAAVARAKGSETLSHFINVTTRS